MDSYWLRHYEVCLQNSSKTAARHGLLSVCIHPWLVDVDHLFDKLKKTLPFVSLRLTTVPNCESRAVNTRREIKFYRCWLAENFFLMMQITQALPCVLMFSPSHLQQRTTISFSYFLFCCHYLKTLMPKRKNRRSQNSPPSTDGVWVTARLWDTTGRAINKLCTWENLKFKITKHFSKLLIRKQKQEICFIKKKRKEQNGKGQACTYTNQSLVVGKFWRLDQTSSPTEVSGWIDI